MILEGGEDEKTEKGEEKNEDLENGEPVLKEEKNDGHESPIRLTLEDDEAITEVDVRILALKLLFNFINLITCLNL